MSNSLALAAVTSTIRYVLERALAVPHPGPVGGAGVTTVRLDQLATGDLADNPGLNVLLFHVSPNAAGNLMSLPGRDASGALRQRPNAALDLDYLVTAFGDEASLAGQRLLARAIIAMASNTLLTRDIVDAARLAHQGTSETAFLAQSDLAEQVERVKVAPLPLSVEDLTRIWGAYPQAPMQPSVAYRATVVLLEADIATRVPKPVLTRALTVDAAVSPTLVSAGPVDGGVAPGVGVEIALRGSGLLRGPQTPTWVEVGGVRLAPAPGSTASELRVMLTDAVPAGVQGVRVAHTRPSPGPGSPPERVLASSNALPLLVHPRVNVTVGTTEVTFGLHPHLGAGQRAMLRLDSFADGIEPRAINLGPVPPGAPPLTEVTVPIADIPAGSWLVTVETEGVGSIPEQTGGVYTGPRLDLP